MATESLGYGYETENLIFFVLLGFYSFWSLCTVDSHLSGQGCRGLLFLTWSGLCRVLWDNFCSAPSSSINSACKLWSSGLESYWHCLSQLVTPWVADFSHPFLPKCWPWDPCTLNQSLIPARSSQILVPFAPWSQACSLRGYKLYCWLMPGAYTESPFHLTVLSTLTLP